MKSGDAVYVAQGDFAAFLTSLFVKLPKTVQGYLAHEKPPPPETLQ